MTLDAARGTWELECTVIASSAPSHLRVPIS
jgi:hypothetical protein